MVTGTENYYRERASEYDLVYSKPERQADIQLVKGWLPQVLNDRRVLEIAAGTGFWTDTFADDAALTLATDVNEATLEVARARRSWPSTVRFEQADAFMLQDIDGDFNAAFVGFFWSHIPIREIDSFLRSLLTRLEENLVLVILDNLYVEGSNHPVIRTDSDGNTYQRRSLSNGSRWEVLKNFPSAEEVQIRLRDHGLSVVTKEWAYYWAAICTRQL